MNIGRHTIAALLILISWVLLWFSHRDHANESESNWVQSQWMLRNFMARWDISPVIDLWTLEKENLYALGAYWNLQWEIIILDGKSLGTRYDQNEVTIDREFWDDTSSLLVYDYVEARESFPLWNSVDKDWLQEAIKSRADEYWIDTSEPFVFQLQWVLVSAEYHIIDRDPNDLEHTHEKHLTSWYQWVFENEEVTILWFYSDSHQWVFTHHSTYLHMHIWNEQQQLWGHIDELQTSDGMVLFLPKK